MEERGHTKRVPWLLAPTQRGWRRSGVVPIESSVLFAGWIEGGVQLAVSAVQEVEERATENESRG